MKSKSYVFMFITSLFVFTSSLSAATINSNAHKQTVTNYIEEINQIQKQIFTLTQKIAFLTTPSDEIYITELNFINNQLDNVTQSMLSYYESLPDLCTEKLNVLVLFNSTNLIHCSLIKLNELNNSNSNIEKMTILQTYCAFHVEANNILNIVSDLVSQ